MEFPEMYAHIDKVDALLKRERGIQITRIKAPATFEELMFTATRDEGEYTEIVGYGWPMATLRWCTGYLKNHIINDYFKNYELKPYQYVALASDELYRIERKQNQQDFRIHPLVDWGVTEAEALAGCYERGFDWGGLYKHFHRASCFCCPLQSLDELRVLREAYPVMWERLRDLDDRAIAQFGRENPLGQFRKSESVRMLEVRFDFEREWRKDRGEPNTKVFFAELNKRYKEANVA
jgi:3'-phosphoadenosine 5'-phosphosulfate sulfotransferase (PAPS reductase)/FAD synthetase